MRGSSGPPLEATARARSSRRRGAPPPRSGGRGSRQPPARTAEREAVHAVAQRPRGDRQSLVGEPCGDPAQGTEAGVALEQEARPHAGPAGRTCEQARRGGRRHFGGRGRAVAPAAPPHALVPAQRGHVPARTVNASPAPCMRVSRGEEAIGHLASRPKKALPEQLLRESSCRHEYHMPNRVISAWGKFCSQRCAHHGPSERLPTETLQDAQKL